MPFILFTFLISISIVSVNLTDAQAADSKILSSNNHVKWHPGHYYTILHRQNKPKHRSEIYQELKRTPVLRGLQVRYEWAELESSEGSYSFSHIDQLLAELAAQEKRLIILLQMRSFNTEKSLVPDYLKTETYEDGVFAYSGLGNSTNSGHNIKLWNTKVHDRFVALVRALGTRYNSHLYFEGIGLTETAMGQPKVQLSKEQFEGYYNNLLSINNELKNNFPNTMTFQFVNYPHVILHSFVNSLKTMGVGLGGPDIFIDEENLFTNRKNSSKGVYSYYQELSGFVPLTPSVMQSNYVNTRTNGSGRKPTIPELFIFARDKLKANYIFWTRAPHFYHEVLALLNSQNLKKDPAGGLDTTCPKAYTSCLN